ncbi:MAG: alpha/beta fold hydrolase [Candidatus Heimdallarchaeota archaeon]|nr:alpha/beta fold hydrolase [Candidatus Heimdallarchaeota archaeon]
MIICYMIDIWSSNFMGKIKPEYGITSNDIDYVRFGSGQKEMIIFWGGPGNILPRGFIFGQFTKGFQTFCEAFTISIVSRKRNLTRGYTTEKMSDDYAEMIKSDFDGHVDIIIGYSYGGMIAQHFGADHPDLVDKIIFLGATHKTTEEGEELDTKFAEFLSEGKKARAFVAIAGAISPPGFARFMMKALLFLIGPFIPLPKYKSFSQDVIIENNAALAHDSFSKLSEITIPTLILVGDKDFYFTTESAKEFDQLLPNSKLKIFEDCGHSVNEQPNFPMIVREFVES